MAATKKATMVTVGGRQGEAAQWQSRGSRAVGQRLRKATAQLAEEEDSGRGLVAEGATRRRQQPRTCSKGRTRRRQQSAVKDGRGGRLLRQGSSRGIGDGAGGRRQQQVVKDGRGGRLLRRGRQWRDWAATGSRRQ
ncbi:hypothetical protein BHM03_00053594 [Ensete ventricosum]|uniref:Uncharacterized protein n=1 Tax=Ensete ventricosum TaxID=4639 RepID=A0A445MLZ7_ENSVE|nr:hypothetical protein BHM03_00053594 [Ensete ventricosum]